MPRYADAANCHAIIAAFATYCRHFAMPHAVEELRFTLRGERVMRM